MEIDVGIIGIIIIVVVVAFMIVDVTYDCLIIHSSECEAELKEIRRLRDNLAILNVIMVAALAGMIVASSARDIITRIKEKIYVRRQKYRRRKYAVD